MKKTIEQLEKEFAEKITKLKKKEKEEKQKLLLKITNTLVLELGKNEFFKQKLFDLLLSNNLNQITNELEKLIIVTPKKENETSKDISDELKINPEKI